MNLSTYIIKLDYYLYYYTDSSGICSKQLHKAEVSAAHVQGLENNERHFKETRCPRGADSRGTAGGFGPPGSWVNRL